MHTQYHTTQGRTGGHMFCIEHSSQHALYQAKVYSSHVVCTSGTESSTVEVNEASPFPLKRNHRPQSWKYGCPKRNRPTNRKWPLSLVVTIVKGKYSTRGQTAHCKIQHEQSTKKVFSALKLSGLNSVGTIHNTHSLTIV